LSLAGLDRRPCGTIRIALLPRDKGERIPAPLLDVRGDAERDPALEPVQLLEGLEYGYRFSLYTHDGAISTDRPEVFIADDEDGRAGRLRTGLYTGLLPVSVSAGGIPVGRVSLEIRSRKLDYLRHYRWMLRDITTEITEVLMERFAASELRFAVAQSRDAPTLYQRFAFLKSLIAGEAFEATIHKVLTQPFISWVEEEELRRPGAGIRANSQVARELAASGPRVALLASGISFSTVPARLRVSRTEATVDNAPNRFVKFALTRWRDLVGAIYDRLSTLPASTITTRGLKETRELGDRLSALLSEELFRELGAMSQFPVSNQVLQKRAGYRDLFRSYLECELAARLSWVGGEDVYGAGQRDVATLYEYWAFFQLARAVADLCNEPFRLGDLVEEADDGLTLALRRGRQRVLSGRVERLGRHLRVELWFNRRFSVGSSGGSWSRPMQPDCSLCVTMEDEIPEHPEPVWLHFDAKYRVEDVLEILGSTDRPEAMVEVAAEETSFGDVRKEAKRDDLLKMHAYRDAIRRSAGAYVLYPGTEGETCEEYHEILPGLGAFPLKPSELGAAEGQGPLRDFLAAVLFHVASQVTQHERGRYWEGAAFDVRTNTKVRVPAAGFISRPPADTLVLLGYVKNRAHLEWIKSTQRYNLRADGRTGSVGLHSRELAAEVVILYGSTGVSAELWRVVGRPELLTSEDLLAMDYPSPGGRLYMCLPIERIEHREWQARLTITIVDDVRRRASPTAALGAPVVTSWLEFARVSGGT
jgi:predicted component of viral defense system (DUF524 family)